MGKPMRTGAHCLFVGRFERLGIVNFRWVSTPPPDLLGRAPPFGHARSSNGGWGLTRSGDG